MGAHAIVCMLPCTFRKGATLCILRADEKEYPWAFGVEPRGRSHETLKGLVMSEHTEQAG